MDIKTTARYLHTDDIFTDEFGKRYQVKSIAHPHVRGIYVYVDGQNYPEFYLNDHAVTLHVPDTKFKVGEFVQARNGRGSVYQIARVIPASRFSPVRYDFDNGSVSASKRARSGHHPVDRADRGYRKVT